MRASRRLFRAMTVARAVDRARVSETALVLVKYAMGAVRAHEKKSAFRARDDAYGSTARARFHRARAMGEDDDERACAICFENVRADAYDAPCCGERARASSVALCNGCVRVVCGMHPSGVGACPRCRARVRVSRGSDGRAFELAPATRTCAVCRQPRAVEETCDACALGRRDPLRYRCARCGGTQRIAHPMWRYMPGAWLVSVDAA